MEPQPPCFWAVTAEPWSEELARLAPDLRETMFSMVGVSRPDDGTLSFEQVRDHPGAVPFRVYSQFDNELTRVGVVVNKDVGLGEFLDDVCRGWPCHVEFFEGGVWNRMQYRTLPDD